LLGEAVGRYSVRFNGEGAEAYELRKDLGFTRRREGAKEEEQIQEHGSAAFWQELYRARQSVFDIFAPSRLRVKSLTD